MQDIKLVRIWYPNPFTGNGLVLVDTPGVNDPDTWREDITYEYLAGADAIIMLLDPMQPLSESEIEFLQHKILGRSIANLIFVVNKIDDVSIEDRAVALGRIENILKKYIPNPTIYPLASKPALKAKMQGNQQSLNSTGFPEFEEGLLTFLSKGRGGLLLKSKIQKGVDHLTGNIQSSINRRIDALNSEKNSVQNKLKEAESELIARTNKKDDLKKELKSNESHISQKLKSLIGSKESYLNNSLKPALMEEPNVSVLRSNILSFQRDCIEALHGGVEDIYGELVVKYGKNSLAIINDIKQIMNSLSSEASSSVQSIQVSHKKVRVERTIEVKKAGAIAGGAIGAGAGFAAASGATTLGITAAGTIGSVAALSTGAAIGIGILTGGIGLLIGAGIASALSENNSTQTRQPSTYVEYDEMVNNRRALLAVDRFLDKLKNNVNRISGMMIDSIIKELVVPIDQEINSQNNLIRQINKDLDLTVDDQKSTRDFLAEKGEDAKKLNQQYKNIITTVESL